MVQMVPEMLTIRGTAKKYPFLTEHRLRIMVAQGKCPGIRTGNRFLVNIPLLLEQINRESLPQTQGEASGE